MKQQDKAIRTLKLKAIMELIVQKYSEEEIEIALSQLENDGVKFYHPEN